MKLNDEIDRKEVSETIFLREIYIVQFKQKLWLSLGSYVTRCMISYERCELRLVGYITKS